MSDDLIDKEPQFADPEKGFIVGARVAIKDGWDQYKEARVIQRYKNGNFILDGRVRQQYREIVDGKAFPTGSHWSSAHAG